MRIKETTCRRCDDGMHEIEDVLLSRHNGLVGPADGVPEELIAKLGLRRGTLERCPGECGDPYGARPRSWVRAT